MVGLLDIAPLREAVRVGAQELEVRGIGVTGVVHLMGRFPELRNLIAGEVPSAERLMAIGPEAMAAIIAAGAGQLADAEAEAVAAGLPLDAQSEILAAILRLTMPQGVGPFVAKLTALLHAVGGSLGKAPQTPESASESPGTAQDTTSPPPSSG